MSQHMFSAEVAPSLVNLDANFTALWNGLFNFAVKTNAAVDATPTAIGAVVLGTPGSANGSRLGFGLNTSWDGTNWRTGTDGGSNGGAAILMPISGVAMEFHVLPKTGAASQTVSNASMVPEMTLSVTSLSPGADNVLSLGASSPRWSTVYAATGSINTSDAREKTAVSPLTANELSAAKALAAEIGTYQWLASVQAKGADARTHIGMTVQRAIEVMTANGLDPMAYGFICYDSWPASTDPGGNEVAAGDRYAFRPDELVLFIARGLDARLAALEAAAHA